MTKVCIILVGLPGLGKTTWRNKFLAYCPDTFIVSTDDVIEEYAKDNNIPYKEAFNVLIKSLDTIHLAKLMSARRHDLVIVDRTNLTERSRKFVRDALGQEYRYICIDFGNDKEMCLLRNAERAKHGRDIPVQVLERMQRLYAAPEETRYSIVIPPSNFTMTMLDSGETVLE